jgi:hypothetical protein
MVALFAFSLQDQVEKYGAYVGLAAFLGLAVLTLLYFAQARELKRLRDWAGRAPERAQELEARVVAQAEEARKAPEPVPERTGTVGPAQPVMAGNGRRPGAAVPVPIGPRPAVAMARAAAAVAAPAAPQRTEEPAQPNGDEPVTVPEERPPGDPTVAMPVDERPADDEHGPEEPPAEETGERVAAVAANGGEPPEAAEAEPVPEEPEPAQDAEDAPAVAGNGAPAPVPIPRATPRPQPRPAPAAATLRSTTTRSTTLPPRRPAPPPRRTGQESSKAGRWTLFTLLAIAVAVVAVAVPVFLLGGDDPEPPPNTTAAPTAAAGGGVAAGGQAAVAARPETVVTILNGTPTEGLASQTRDKLIAEGYSDEQGMIRTGNNTDQQRQDSVVLYAEGQRRQARDVGSILGVTAFEAVDAETQALADATDATNSGRSSDIVVILGGDQSP